MVGARRKVGGPSSLSGLLSCIKSKSARERFLMRGDSLARSTVHIICLLKTLLAIPARGVANCRGSRVAGKFTRDTRPATIRLSLARGVPESGNL